MRRHTLDLIVPFIALTLAISFVAVLPAVGQDKDKIISKLEELHGKLGDEKQALANKVNAVIHQIEAGAYNGALNKLQNDVKKSISAWVEDPNLRQELLDLVDEIIDLIKGVVPPPPLTPDFEISATPELEVIQGSSNTTAITITSVNNFTQQVNLTASVSAVSVTLSLNPSAVTPPPNGSVTSTLRVEAAADTEPDRYEMTVTGTNGSLEHSVEITLKVIVATPPPPTEDFEVSATPDTLIVQQGDSNSSVITITSLHGFNQSVDLAVTSMPISGVSISIEPQQIIPPADSFAISVLTVDVATNVAPGGYEITVTGTSGALTHNESILLQVKAPPIPPTPDFSVIAFPTTLTVKQGDSATSTIIVVSHNGFSQPVSLTWTIELASGLEVTLSPSEVTPEPDGFAFSTLTVNVAGTAPINDFEITVIGTSGLALRAETTISLKVIAEMTPPEIVNVMRLPESPNYDESVTVLASVTDSGSGVKEVIVSYSDGSTWQNVTTTLQEGVHRGIIPAFNFGLLIQYRVYASDNSGNWATSSVYFYRVVDRDAPEIGVPSWSPEQPAANEKITVNVTVTEPEAASGVDRVILWYTNKTLVVWQPIAMTQSLGNWTASITGQSDTTVEFKIEAYDMAGNKTQSDAQEFTVAPPGFPLSLILAAIIAIGAIIGGSAYYVRRRQRRGTVSSPTHPPPATTSLKRALKTHNDRSVGSKGYLRLL